MEQHAQASCVGSYPEPEQEQRRVLGPGLVLRQLEPECEHEPAPELAPVLAREPALEFVLAIRLKVKRTSVYAAFPEVLSVVTNGLSKAYPFQGAI